MTQPSLEQVIVPVMTYQTLDEISETAVDYLLALWLLRSTMPEAEWLELFVDALTLVLAQAEGVGRAFGSVAVPVDGDLLLPDEPDGQRRRPPDSFEQFSGIAPAPDETVTEERVEEIRDKVEKSVKTLTREIEREEPEPPTRVERMVRDEVIQQMQRGHQDGVRISGAATGYRRGVNPDCCELCFWLWKEGFVYQIDQPMHRHTGCRCVPVPTTDPVGGMKRRDFDQAARDLLNRYYTDTLDETTYRRTTEPNQ